MTADATEDWSLAVEVDAIGLGLAVKAGRLALRWRQRVVAH